MQHARPAARDRGRVQSGRQPMAGGLDAVDLDLWLIEERVEQSHGVRAAADAGDKRIGQAAFGLVHLLAGLAPDDALEIAHHHRIGMRPRDRADAVERVRDVGHPVAQCLVHGVLERARAGRDRHHFGAQHLHAEDVLLLARDVDLAHVDDDPRLAHAPRQQDLAEHVVDLVGAGVVELLALEIDFGAAAMRRHAFGEVERRRPADIVRQIIVHLGLERRVGPRGRVGLLEIENDRHQGLGHEPSAEQAEMAALVGAGAE